MRYLALTLLILATWCVGLIDQATANAVRALQAGRKPGGISLLWYVLVVPIVAGALVCGAYFLDRMLPDLGTTLVGSGAGILLAHSIFRTVFAHRKLRSLTSPDRARLAQEAYRVADLHRDARLTREDALQELERHCPGFQRSDYERAFAQGLFESR